MILGIPRETYPSERRVAVVPADLRRLAAKGSAVLVERGAGERAGYPDGEYLERGAEIVERGALFARADAIAQVRAYGSNPDAGAGDLDLLRPGQVLFAFMDPLGSPDAAERLAQTGVIAFAVELVPRISRAQSMDALSSMANIAGYRAVLLAATHMSKLLPMFMTAAGTIAASHVFVLGAGVAGLQAIATARRLGAVVKAYDVRPEVAEQVVSVGGEFVVLDLKAETGGDASGYAGEQSADFYRRQRTQLAEYIRASDAVITTAAIPGLRAPVLVTEEMMVGMKSGAVILDLAAESGGNCSVTRAGETVEHEGVLVIGPTNVASDLAYHASQMYSRNVVTFIGHLLDDEGSLRVSVDDEITAATLVCRDGKIDNPRVAAALNNRVA